MWTDRTEILIGESGLQSLKNAQIAVIGLGGVGGYVAYLLARAGVGKLKLVDFDTVDETNINRQIVARTDTIGKFKVDVMSSEIAKINPDCQVLGFKTRVSEGTLLDLDLKSCDIVIDAIDSVTDKVNLICFCKEHGIEIISAMGSGNRIEIPQFEIMDIFKTSNDGLAKIMRKKLKERGIKNLDVVSCKQKAILNSNNQNIDNCDDACCCEKGDCEKNLTDDAVDKISVHRKIGSVSYFPAMCGCVLSAAVINKLLQNNSNSH